jgi:hypothetical protein
MEAKETVGKVICPSCNRGMTVTDCHQILFSERLVQAVYRCNNCDAETTVMRGQGAEPRWCVDARPGSVGSSKPPGTKAAFPPA